MVNAKTIIPVIAVVIAGAFIVFFLYKSLRTTDGIQAPAQTNFEEQAGETENPELPVLAINHLRSVVTTGGSFMVEEQLANGAAHERYVVSYLSDGYRINGLLTIPLADAPPSGHPAILFIHGYIPPDIYDTINSYPTYQAKLANAGFVTFKPDLRGHDHSEGKPSSAHFSHDYVIDSLHALAYLNQHPSVDPDRMGYWGHSNGGEIGLRIALLDTSVKAFSLWAGVVGSYESMLETHVDDIPFLEQDNPLTQRYGLPSENRELWSLMDPYTYLVDIRVPIELQHATGDESVPVELSRELESALRKAGVATEYIEYQGDDHNIGQNSSAAWQTTIAFFQEHL